MPGVIPSGKRMPSGSRSAATASRAQNTPRNSRWPSTDVIERSRGHLTSVTILKMGRYMATTMPPTTTPRKTIIIGSSNEVSAVTAASTSSS